MKFGDKLIILRKKSGMSQEELAEHLGVSRQSVSKWESNNTYPETDKIVQIANLFECSMDDLINDKITDVEGSLRKNKNNFNIMIDSLLEFITKTVNMFSKMTFLEGLQCIIEMLIVGFILWIIGSIIISISSSVIAGLFKFISGDVVIKARLFTTGILNILWFVLSMIFIIHTFKIRYLNKYEKELVKKEEKVETKKVRETKKEEKITVSNEEPFAFLGGLSKIIIYFIKFIALCFLISVVCSMIPLLILLVLSLALITTNILFTGTTISLIGSIIISIQIIVLIIYFVINKTPNAKIHIITFISSIILIGVGIGISVLSIKNFKIVENTNLTPKSINIEYIDNLVIDTHNNSIYNYEVDDTITDNKIEVIKNIDSRIINISKSNIITEDNMNVIYINEDFNRDINSLLKVIKQDLKKSKLSSFNESNEITIKANTNTINKLIDNQKRLYLVKEDINDTKRQITIIESKVEFSGEYDRDDIVYDAIKDELIILDDDYNCNKKVNNTPYGEKIYFDCYEKVFEMD